MYNGNNRLPKENHVYEPTIFMSFIDAGAKSFGYPKIGL